VAGWFSGRAVGGAGDGATTWLNDEAPGGDIDGDDEAASREFGSTGARVDGSSDEGNGGEAGDGGDAGNCGEVAGGGDGGDTDSIPAGGEADVAGELGDGEQDKIDVCGNADGIADADIDVCGNADGIADAEKIAAPPARTSLCGDERAGGPPTG
jgi:hypothetical protein